MWQSVAPGTVLLSRLFKENRNVRSRFRINPAPADDAKLLDNPFLLLFIGVASPH